jgi:hypothetical protein
VVIIKRRNLIYRQPGKSGSTMILHVKFSGKRSRSARRTRKKRGSSGDIRVEKYLEKYLPECVQGTAIDP